jgi:phosphoesterase RecJ-like protein
MSVLKDYSGLFRDQDRKDRILTFIANFALLLKTNNIHNILILSHDLVDIDGFSSAIGLKHLISKVFSDLNISCHIVFSTINTQIQPLLSAIKMNESEYYVKELTINPDLIILVDCNNLSNVDSGIKGLGDSIPVVIVDHHQSDLVFPKNYRFWYIDSNASSNAEIILDFFSVLQVSFDSVIGYLLLAGLIADTGQFRFANSETYIRLSSLEEAGIYVKDALSLLQSKNYEFSERIARIKAGMRVTELLIFKEYIALISNVSSHQASAARGLVELGCDLSFIIAKEKPKRNLSFSISARASSSFVKAMNFSAATFLSDFFKKYDGNGGGHTGAAAGKGKVQEEMLLSWLNKIKKSESESSDPKNKKEWTEQNVIDFIKSELIQELQKIGEWKAHY